MRSGVHQADFESRWEAAPAVAVVIALQAGLGLVSQAQGWDLWRLPGATWFVLVGPELVLFVALAWRWPRHQLEELGKRHMAGASLFALIALGNLAALALLIGSLLGGYAKSGIELLTQAMVLWGTNVIAFGLLFWAVDRGGPVRRRGDDPPPPDFQFPQTGQAPPDGEEPWQPGLLEYLYVAYTNAIAFSPTDTMPLTRQAKLLMTVESGTSALTLLVVAARAVNTLR